MEQERNAAPWPPTVAAWRGICSRRSAVHESAPLSGTALSHDAYLIPAAGASGIYECPGIQQPVDDTPVASLSRSVERCAPSRVGRAHVCSSLEEEVDADRLPIGCCQRQLCSQFRFEALLFVLQSSASKKIRSHICPEFSPQWIKNYIIFCCFYELILFQFFSFLFLLSWKNC